MTGRTNSISGAAPKLFTPTAVITGSTLRITDRNGDFCTGFTVYTDEESPEYFERDDNVIYIPDYFFGDSTIHIVSRSDILQKSDVFRIEYEEAAEE